MNDYSIYRLRGHHVTIEDSPLGYTPLFYRKKEFSFVNALQSSAQDFPDNLFG